MILKFFDIFLKMKDLTTSEAFLVSHVCNTESVQNNQTIAVWTVSIYLYNEAFVL